jgi:hypothetical protein
MDLSMKLLRFKAIEEAKKSASKEVDLLRQIVGRSAVNTAKKPSSRKKRSVGKK